MGSGSSAAGRPLLTGGGGGGGGGRDTSTTPATGLAPQWTGSGSAATGADPGQGGYENGYLRVGPGTLCPSLARVQQTLRLLHNRGLQVTRVKVGRMDGANAATVDVIRTVLEACPDLTSLRVLPDSFKELKADGKPESATLRDCCASLGMAPNLQQLTLSGNFLTDEDCAALGTALALIPRLQTLYLANFVLKGGGPNLHLLLQGMVHTRQLVHVDLSGNNLGQQREECIVALCDGLLGLTKLQELVLSHNGLQTSHIARLAPVMPALAALHTLNLSANKFDSGSVMWLVACAEAAKALSHLLVADVGIPFEDLKTLLKGLQRIPHLTHISLRGTSLTDDQLTDLCACVNVPPTVEVE